MVEVSPAVRLEAVYEKVVQPEAVPGVQQVVEQGVPGGHYEEQVQQAEEMSAA